ncbi:MAG: chorismate-binding protein [Oligoflexia bacterium]|nr:chorismate-binding protein [Oligoflexia bacterium]
MKLNCIDKQKWLEEGFIIQNLKGEYILGQGAFSYGDRACPYSLYHPDFFFKNKKAWIYPSSICRFDKKHFFDFLFSREKTFKKRSQKSFCLFESSQKPSFLLYQECFVQAQQAILQGLFQKVAPAFCETFFNTAPVLNLLKNLFKNTFHFKQGFLYGFWNRQSGFLGFTPEFLFSMNGNHFSTMALAGTAEQNSPSLFTGRKELKEHEFVVKGLEKKLTDLTRWKQKKQSEMLFPPLKHLRTDLSGQWLSSFDFERVCQILHPTPAVGGYPKEESWLWLKEQRSQKTRSYFASPFAFFESNARSFCLVALRALEWDHKESRIFSGGGWIKESDLQKEWLELYLKRQQVKSFFK